MSEVFDFLVKFVSKPNEVLKELIHIYGNWVYAFLFLIVFAETGLIIASFLMPFLPGDALIFAIGMLSHDNMLDIKIVIPMLIIAALLGDNLNYYVGRKFGNYIISKEKFLFLKKEHIERSKSFFDKNGKNSVIMARFIPVIRTIVPFLSGASQLNYGVFLLYSFIGAVLWVGVIGVTGYFLGSIAMVNHNLEYAILTIIVIANIPLIKQIFFKKKTKNHNI